MKNKKIKWILSIAAAVLLLGPLILSPLVGKANNSQQAELSRAVKEIFDARARSLIKDSASKKALSYYDRFGIASNHLPFGHQRKLYPIMTLLKNSASGHIPMKKPR